MTEEFAKKIEKINDLVYNLNRYRNLYYNENVSEVSDLEYDTMFDELKRLEDETGYILSNSPTKEVGYTVASALEKVEHNHKMLSLDKTKNPEEVIKFLGDKPAVIMAKMDGLTCSLTYRDHFLVDAETRGNGFVGERVIHNVKVIENVPKWISIGGEVVIDGEVIVPLDEFEKINENLPDEEKYRNPRNLAGGSLRQLDSRISQKRKLKFIAWRLVSGFGTNRFFERWRVLSGLGFEVVPLIYTPSFNTVDFLNEQVDTIKGFCKDLNYPIDGCVFGFDDIEYAESLGETSHHSRGQIAFKFYDDVFVSKLRYVDWTIGKTGALTPTAVFDPIEIDGTIVSRASMHNISIMENLGVRLGCTIYIYKANQIIPQVDWCEFDGEEDIVIPTICPYCGKETFIKTDNHTKTLMCRNGDCAGTLLYRLSSFVSREGANIDGLSEATLEKFIALEWVKNYRDIYHLDRYLSDIEQLEGFGKKSAQKLINAIEKSREIKLENYLVALNISGIGKANAKLISKQFNGKYSEFIKALENKFDFTSIDGFGSVAQNCIYNWFYNDKLSVGLAEEFTFIEEDNENNATEKSLNGLRFCITGTFSRSRDELVSELESRGAIFVSSVSKKLDILFVGEKAGSKLEKAKELGVKIANEEELQKML